MPWYFLSHLTHADYYSGKTGADFQKLDEVKLREVVARKDKIVSKYVYSWRKLATNRLFNCHDVIYLSSLYTLVIYNEWMMNFALKLKIGNWKFSLKFSTKFCFQITIGYWLPCLCVSYDHSVFLYVKIKEGIQSSFYFYEMYYSDVWNIEFKPTPLQLLIFWFLLVWQVREPREFFDGWSLTVSGMKDIWYLITENIKSYWGQGVLPIIISFTDMLSVTFLFIFHCFESFWYEIRCRLYGQKS